MARTGSEKWTRRSLLAGVLLLVAGGLAWGYRTLRQDARAPVRQEMSRVEMAVLSTESAERGPVQPLPFNHRFHVRELSLSCEYCHGGARVSDVAGLPPTSVCMGCHRVAGRDLDAVQILRGRYADPGRAVPWVRVHKLPEFVQFSHRAHTRNAIDCARCHGPVENMVRIYRWSPLTMGWCLECHRQAPAAGDSATTFRLVRELPLPKIPAGRQPRGLNPYRIPQSYASTRAPIDCATCHY